MWQVKVQLTFKNVIETMFPKKHFSNDSRSPAIHQRHSTLQQVAPKVKQIIWVSNYRKFLSWIRKWHMRIVDSIVVNNQSRISLLLTKGRFWQWKDLKTFLCCRHPWGQISEAREFNKRFDFFWWCDKLIGFHNFTCWHRWEFPRITRAFIPIKNKHISETIQRNTRKCFWCVNY